MLMFSFAPVSGSHPDYRPLAKLLALSLLVALLLKNSVENVKLFKADGVRLGLVYVLAVFALANLSSYSEFLYFNF